MQQFLAGGITVAAWVAALVFFRYYKQTKDRFFACFGGAFLLEGLNRIPWAISSTDQDSHPVVYLLRLAGYLLILYAIWQKNRRVQ